jgi:hypothetical protein
MHIQEPADEFTTLRGTIIGFTKFENGDDADCQLLLTDGTIIQLDPFVGCAWEYENRHELLNKEIEAKRAWLSMGAWLCNEGDLIII